MTMIDDLEELGLTERQIEGITRIFRRQADEHRNTIETIASNRVDARINEMLSVNNGHPRRKLRWWQYAIPAVVIITASVRYFIWMVEIAPRLKGGPTFRWEWRLNPLDLLSVNYHLNEKYWVQAGIVGFAVGLMLLFLVVRKLRSRPTNVKHFKKIRNARASRLERKAAELRNGGTP